MPNPPARQSNPSTTTPTFDPVIARMTEVRRPRRLRGLHRTPITLVVGERQFTIA